MKTPKTNLVIITLLLVLLFISIDCKNNNVSPVSGDNYPNVDSIGIDADPTIVAKLPIASRSFRMGTAGFVPDNYPNSSDADWKYFYYTGASLYGGEFGVHVSPTANLNSEGIPSQVVTAYESMRNIEPYVALAVSPDEGPFTIQRGEELKSAAIAIAKKYKPGILSLGVESNSLYLAQQSSFDLYVQYVREIYDSIKVVSPNTQVMNNFQLDRMKGATALTGENYVPNWDLINKFSGKMDLISFTVYPFLNYKTVDSIPDNYLDEIRSHTSLPVIITETGWPSVNLSSGVAGSDSAQINYMLKLIKMADGINVKILNWVLPHDANFGVAGGIFDHISLFKNDGTAKPAYEYWKAVNSLPFQ